MAEVEPPLARIAFQDSNIAAAGPAKPTANLPRHPTTRSLSTPNTPDNERGTDPLSAHIIALTQTTVDASAESPSFRRGLSDLVGVTLKDKSKENAADSSQVYEADKRERKKRVSFFAKLRGKDIVHDEHLESTDELSRAEGAHASMFCDNMKTEKPTYIRVRASNKATREFNNLFLAQELFGASETSGVASNASEARASAIWAMKFSNDGRFLATGGQDMVVRVWRVLSSPSDRMTDNHGEPALDSSLNAGVFCVKPHREYKGHTADILDLSWSKNNFLLSSSMDKTVRLWHVSREECLCCFQHSDFVTSIAFHPKDDHFFLSGSLDCKLRLWNIPEKQVANWNELPELITAVAFDPSGRMAIAGSFTGLCLFYETDGLRYHTQIHVKSSRGRNSQGSKITGIQAVSLYPENPHAEVKLLITSNDSRVRVYNMRDKSLETKFKGNENKCSQIRASFNDDLSYVICGSEDREVYIWSAKGLHGSKDKKPVEHFEAHTNMVTATAFAPNNAREHLAASGDQIYELVAAHRQKFPAANRSTTSTEISVESATHGSADGNIIVCADYSGRIKVFRQDSAMNLRNRADDRSDVASIHSRIVLRRHSSSKSSISSSPPKRSPSVRSQESSSIVRKPHESVVPTSPARIRSGTNQTTSSSGTSGIHTLPAPSIQLNGNPGKARSGLTSHLFRTASTTDPSRLSASRANQNDRRMSQATTSTDSQGERDRTSRQVNQSQTRNRSQSRARSKSRSPSRDRQTSNRNAEDQITNGENPQDREREPRVEANPYLSEGGISFGFYDVEPDPTRTNDQRPNNTRMQTTDSWAEMESQHVVRCNSCGSDSFAVTQVHGVMRLTCQNCETVLQNAETFNN